MRTIYSSVPPITTAGLQLIPTGESSWRVVDGTGRAIGHIDLEHTAAGTRYHARRFHVPTLTNLQLGSFWSLEDARDCLRWM